MLRLLVVEDQADFYENYLLRVFSHLLPTEEISIAHAPGLQAALAALVEPWDVVLVDFALGPRVSFQNHPVRNGTDLVAFRRAVEEHQGEALPRAAIWGIAANQVSNHLLMEAGADGFWSKEQVVEMAETIAGALKNQPEKKDTDE